MDEEIYNISYVEADPFLPVSPNATFGDTQEWSAFVAFMEVLFIFRELLMLIVGVITIIIDILLIFMITKFERLKTPINRYIYHMAIMNLIYFFFLPLFLFIFYHLIGGGPTIRSTFCYLDMVECTAVLGYWIFATSIGIEWMVRSKRESWITKAQFYYDNKFNLIYLFLGINLVTGIIGCIYNYRTEQYILLLIMPTLVVIVIVLNYIKRTGNFDDENLKTEYYLSISTFVIFLHLPYFVVDTLHPFLHIFILYLSYLVFPLFTTSTPIIIFRFLLQKNKYFKMAFDAMFKKSVRNYESNDLDGDDDDDNISRTQGNCIGNSITHNVV